MTEIFRITGLHSINFDEAATGPYRLAEGSVPRDMDQILSRQEVISLLPKLPAYPEGLRSHCLAKGVSKVGCDVSIQANRNAGETDADMERYRQRLTRTLEDAGLYIATQGARGTRAVLHYKMDNAINDSYKTILWGELEEMGGRDVLGAKVKHSYLEGMKLTLYCEKCWRPLAGVPIGPNEVFCPSFEEDSDANGRADNWDVAGGAVLTMHSTIVLHGCHSQKAVCANAGDGIESAAFTGPAGTTEVVAYAWIARPAAGSNIRVYLRDTSLNVTRASALYNTAGWPTETAKDGATTFYQVSASTNVGLVPASNHELWILITDSVATTFYVDKCFWKWGTTIVPDEWCGHWLIYNHYDAHWLANYPGGAIAGDEGHINYFDVDDLKGDVEARLQLLIEYEQKADSNAGAKDVIVGRRSEEPPCSLGWWLEAEDGSIVNNWDAVALARCSAGARRINNANAAGHVEWNMWVDYGLPAIYALQGSSYDVYGAVKTNDPINTQYQLVWACGIPVRAFENIPVKQPTANVWELIRLGTVDLGIFMRQGRNISDIYIRVEYQKDAADTAEIDFIWLIPRNEPEMRLDSPYRALTQYYVSVNERWVVDHSDDFDYLAHEELIHGAQHWFNDLLCRGQIMTLKPDEENRLYFVAITIQAGFVLAQLYEAHGAATNLELIINMAYLPQFVSPLE